MRLGLLLFNIIVLFSNQSWSRVTDKQVNYKFENRKIEISTNDGFHLNVEAPAEAIDEVKKNKFKPSIKTEKLIVFEIPITSLRGRISFYVCDDKKTACEKHEKEYNFSDAKTNIKNINLEPKSKKIVNHKTKVLYVFSAPWCPACIRMQTEVFNKPEVIKELSKINIKKINIDLPENLEIVDRFKVKAIPTLVLVNKKDEEIYRWLDYQDSEKLISEFKKNANKDLTIDQIEKKAFQGDADAITNMGFLSYNSLNYSEAIKWFSLSKNQTDLKYKIASQVSQAEENFQEDSERKKEYIQTLNQAIKQTDSKIDRIRFTIDLSEKLKEQGEYTDDTKELTKKALSDLESIKESEIKSEFILSTYGDIGDFPKEEIELLKFRIFGLLNLTNKKDESFKKIVQLLEARKIENDKPGQILLRIAYLKEIGKKDQVTSLYETLVQQFSDTYVYYEKFSRFLFKEKKYDQALAQVNQGLEFSEGNKPQLLLLKAKILNEMKNKSETLQVLDQALADKNIHHKKYKKVVTQIEKLKQELNQ